MKLGIILFVLFVGISYQYTHSQHTICVKSQILNLVDDSCKWKEVSETEFCGEHHMYEPECNPGYGHDFCVPKGGKCPWCFKPISVIGADTCKYYPTI